MALSGRIYETAERDPAFRTRVAGERLVVDVSIALSDAMKARGVTCEELARRLSVPTAEVTKLLRGDSTVTVAAAAQVAQSLGYRARLIFEPDPAIAVTPWRTIRDCS